MKKTVEFKGSAEGIFIVLNENISFGECLIEIESQLEKSIGFFKDATIVGTKGKSLSYSQKAALEALLQEKFGLKVASLELLSNHKSNNKNKSRIVNTPKFVIKNKEMVKYIKEINQKQKLSIESLKCENTQLKAMVEKLSSKANEYPTKFLFSTQRSGYNITYKGNIVVVGDVNAGAELVAEGNIVVLGRLKGCAHAGSNGDMNTVIIANEMKPIQLRIGGVISGPEAITLKNQNKTTKALLKNGAIVLKCV